MKTFKRLFICAAFSLLFAFSAEAQIIDSFPWFKAPGKFEPIKIIDWNSTFALPDLRGTVLTTKSIQVSNQKIALPPTVRVLKSPVILKQKDNCIEVYCARTRSCSDCVMLWRDSNGDRKIQPKRELRCVCKEGGDNCSIKARRTDCK